MMKCITICQPYAELIMRGDKRVENRTWPCVLAGLRPSLDKPVEMLIHAGKSRNWLTLGPSGTRDEVYRIDVADMPFGAIQGVASLVGCYSIEAMERYADTAKYLPPQMQWLPDHPHTIGPWCWVLQDARRFSKPIPYRGAQGVFDVPAEVVAEAMQEASPR
jgi:hypothetical protein